MIYSGRNLHSFNSIESWKNYIDKLINEEKKNNNHLFVLNFIAIFNYNFLKILFFLNEREIDYLNFFNYGVPTYDKKPKNFNIYSHYKQKFMQVIYRPRFAYVTLKTNCDSPDEALKILPTLIGFDLEGVELDANLNLFLRLGYQEPTMEARRHGLESLIGKSLTMSLGEAESDTWQAIKAFDWLDSNNNLFKTATHPESTRKLLEALDSNHWKIHLTNGAKTLYLGSNDSANSESLNALLSEHQLTGLQLKGEVSGQALIGNSPNLPFLNRVQQALDPNGIFEPFSQPIAESA